MARRFQGGTSSEVLNASTVLNQDMVQLRHDIGTSNDTDKALPLSVFQSCPIAICESNGNASAKVGTVANFQDFTLLPGREVLVYFVSGNTADSPTFNLNNTGGFPLVCENQSAGVSIGSGSWGAGVFLQLKFVDITVNGIQIQKWVIIGHKSEKDFYVCNTANSGSPALTGVGLYSYYDDLVVNVQFANGHYGSDFTLAIDSLAAKPIYVVKNGSDVLMTSHAIDRNVASEGSQNWYCQEKTTLKLRFDTTLDGWEVIGNPIVLSSDDYTIYADGSTKYNTYWKVGTDTDVAQAVSKADLGVYQPAVVYVMNWITTSAPYGNNFETLTYEGPNYHFQYFKTGEQNWTAILWTYFFDKPIFLRCAFGVYFVSSPR